ncbi:MAG: TolC family outer membrane protein [Rubrivivax sp.]|nr:TolC family outer membrane protein [Rubrivivax sp.]
MTKTTPGGGWSRPALAALALVALSALPFGPFAPLGRSLAAEADRIDLMTSYEQALQHDPRMRAAEEALAAGREKAEQGKALLRPQVGLSASLTRIDERTSSSLPPALAGLVPDERSGQAHQVALQMTQPLYNAKSRAEKEQLAQQSGLAEIQHRQAAQDLVKRVGETYLAVLLAEETLRVVRAEKAAVQMQRDRAQARFEVGRGRITEVQEAQARHDSVLTREISAESTLVQRRAQYAELTGSNGQGLRPLAPGFAPAAPAPDNLEAWQQKGLAANPRVQLRQGELAIAEAETSKWKLAARPTLDLVASYADRGQHAGLSASLAGDGSRTASIGLQFNVPLYAGGGIHSRERESHARVRQAEQELAGARRDTRLEVQDTFLAVKTGVSRVGALEQQVRSAATALEATTLGRDVGNRTELDVLDAQQRLFAARLDLAQARTDYLLGRLRLAAAAGELGPGDLRALNAYLAP